jgi:hypothetical protein
MSKFSLKSYFVINLDLSFSKNHKMWSDEINAKLIVQKRGMLLEEFKLGIWTKEEYLARIAELDGSFTPTPKLNTQAPEPTPEQQKVREYSPDWDDILYSSS